MDPEIDALPQGQQAEAGEQAKPDAAATEVQGEQGAEAKPEGEEGAEKDPPKKEKTPEQRENDRLRRRVDNLTRRRYELEAQLGRQTGEPRTRENPPSDDEPVTLSKADLERMVEERAAQRAPSIADQRAEAERRSGIVKSLAKQWGQEDFDAKASDLDEVFGGLADAQGRPKPATDAIFDADNPKAVIEYLTDPDNADEAERIAHLPAARAGMAIAKLEIKLKEEAAKAKPQPSKAAKPLETVKGGGVSTGMPDPSNTKAYIAWANAQEAAERR